MGFKLDAMLEVVREDIPTILDNGIVVLDGKEAMGKGVCNSKTHEARRAADLISMHL